MKRKKNRRQLLNLIRQESVAFAERERERRRERKAARTAAQRQEAVWDMNE